MPPKIKWVNSKKVNQGSFSRKMSHLAVFIKNEGNTFTHTLMAWNTSFNLHSQESLAKFENRSTPKPAQKINGHS